MRRPTPDETPAAFLIRFAGLAAILGFAAVAVWAMFLQ